MADQFRDRHHPATPNMIEAEGYVVPMPEKQSTVNTLGPGADAPGNLPIKEHKFREAVGELLTVVNTFHGTEQLRARLSMFLAEYTAQLEKGSVNALQQAVSEVRVPGELSPLRREVFKAGARAAIAKMSEALARAKP